MFGIKRLFSSSSSFSSTQSELVKTLLTMAWFVEARDPYTGGHLWRVSRFAYEVSNELELNEKTSVIISLGGFLHDLGKISIPDEILNKTGRLTDEEYDIIKTHPAMGHKLLSTHPLSHLVEDAVLSHHERPDGKGYPHGLKEKDISQMARIIGVCDAFDAMTSSRPYRAGMPKKKAMSILVEEQTKQFDKDVVQAFISLDEKGVLDHIIGHSDEGIPLEVCPMCGPVLVVQKENKEGDKIYCRNCTGEFSLAMKNGKLLPVPTGGQGKPEDLIAQEDLHILGAMLNQTSQYLTDIGI
ncbi:HD-GYP domain-containing protein [Vibrio salinus]|uniref:HD-GYP domain-containing protein n=1 Tax=Vibrio salinus TaxID=2899784 RepID=UPI001E4A3420|nr:HD-GYP domain-containing protein [Vibrio salinus]MCE0492495.1 HD-GYP domain-containing protein [Vibrio salinus]